MARQRFIWPGIWKDPVFGRLTSDEQVLFIGLFSIADDEGRLLADPSFLRAEIFAYKEYSLRKVTTLKRSLVGKCVNVHLYRVDEQNYIALLKWDEYQKPKYPKPSKIPPPFLQIGGSFPQNGEGFPENSSLGWVGLGRDGLDRAGLGSNPTAMEETEEEILREVRRIAAALTDADETTEGVIAFYARQLPMGAVAKVRESVESQQKRVGAGWAVNALKDEIKERAA